MSSATFFVQECPTCGRQLQVRLEYLGRTIACPHCEGLFEASDPALARKLSDSDELLLKADELLASAERKSRPR